jgi:hypothetical protein
VKVTTVSASIKFSKDTGSGWKTLELGAEASLDSEDDWFLAQQGLYASLTAQLKSLWSKNGIVMEHAPDDPKTAIEPGSWEELEQAPLPKDHLCAQHQTEFKKYEKDGWHWYSHPVKGESGSWCREQPLLLKGWRNG